MKLKEKNISRQLPQKTFFMVDQIKSQERLPKLRAQRSWFWQLIKGIQRTFKSKLISQKI